MARKMTADRARAVNRKRALRDNGPDWEREVSRLALVDDRPVEMPGHPTEADRLAIEPRKVTP